MNKRFYLVVTVFSILFLSAINAQAEELGQVYVDGVQISPPYNWDGVGSDTLRVNGYVYDVVWRPGDPTPSITVTATCRSLHQAKVNALELSRAGSSYQERIAIFAEALRGSGHFKSVRTFELGVYVIANNENEEQEIILPEKDSSFDLMAFHKNLVASFTATVESGGLIAFGTQRMGKGHKYHVTTQSEFMEQTERCLEKISRGESLTPADIKNTALKNPLFLKDLYQRNQAVQ